MVSTSYTKTNKEDTKYSKKTPPWLDALRGGKMYFYIFFDRRLVRLCLISTLLLIVWSINLVSLSSSVAFVNNIIINVMYNSINLSI